MICGPEPVVKAAATMPAADALVPLPANTLMLPAVLALVITPPVWSIVTLPLVDLMVVAPPVELLVTGLRTKTPVPALLPLPVMVMASAPAKLLPPAKLTTEPDPPSRFTPILPPVPVKVIAPLELTWLLPKYTPVCGVEVPVMLMAPVLPVTLAARLTPWSAPVPAVPLRVMLPVPVAVTALETRMPLVEAAVVEPVKWMLPVVVRPTVPVDVLALLRVVTVPTFKPVLSTNVTEPVLPASVVIALLALSSV